MAAVAPEGNDCHVPRMFDLMSGPNAPVARAFQWCQWEVRACDLAGAPYSEPQDLRDSAVRRSIEEEALASDVLWWAMSCETLSRI